MRPDGKTRSQARIGYSLKSLRISMKLCDWSHRSVFSSAPWSRESSSLYFESWKRRWKWTISFPERVALMCQLRHRAKYQRSGRFRREWSHCVVWWQRLHVPQRFFYSCSPWFSGKRASCWWCAYLSIQTQRFKGAAHWQDRVCSWKWDWPRSVDNAQWNAYFKFKQKGLDQKTNHQELMKTETEEIFVWPKPQQYQKYHLRRWANAEKNWNVHLKSSFRKVREREQYDSDWRGWLFVPQ